jgi:hypothetical protein
MYLLGGYLYTPEKLRQYFQARGLTLQNHGVGITASRFLREHGHNYRVKSCMYQGQHMFLFLVTSKLETSDAAMFHFEETEEALQMKKELDLDATFVTAIY